MTTMEVEKVVTYQCALCGTQQIVPLGAAVVIENNTQVIYFGPLSGSQVEDQWICEDCTLCEDSTLFEDTNED